MKLNKILFCAAMTSILPLQHAFSAPVNSVEVQVIDPNGGTSQLLLQKMSGSMQVVADQLSPPYQTTIILLYHSTVPVKRVVFFVLSGENFKKAVDNRRRGCYILGYKKGIDEEAVRRRSQRGSPRGARDLTGSGTVPPLSRSPNGNQ